MTGDQIIFDFGDENDPVAVPVPVTVAPIQSLRLACPEHPDLQQEGAASHLGPRHVTVIWRECGCTSLHTVTT